MASLRFDNNTLSVIPLIPPYVTSLDLGSNAITTLDGLPVGLKVLQMGCALITTLDGLPMGLEELSIYHTPIASLVGIPMGLEELSIYHTPIASLVGIPSGLKELFMDHTAIASLEGLPLSVENVQIYEDGPFDITPLFIAAYCGVLRSVNVNHLAGQGEAGRELQRAVCVPLNKRPARVVIVVLSSSSVPRVGTRAAVRRLHRAFLVREMAGMLG